MTVVARVNATMYVASRPSPAGCSSWASTRFAANASGTITTAVSRVHSEPRIRSFLSTPSYGLGRVAAPVAPPLLPLLPLRTVSRAVTSSAPSGDTGSSWGPEGY